MLNERLRSLPYLVHTNRELGLMLAGKKPLAYFADGKGFYPDVVARYLRLFDKHIATGLIIRRDHFSDVSWPQCKVCHHILFALRGEEWRIEAMLDLVLSHESWTVEKERRQGELLGYEEWMTTYWIEQIYGR